MGSEWPRVVIADVCELIVDCVNKTAPVVEGPTPFKMIRTPNVKNGVVNTDTCRFVEAETFEKWTRRASVKIGDVLLTREAPLGEVGIVTSGENLFLGQRLMQYRANPELLDSKFLLYSFLSHDLQHQFSMHEGSGSVVSHIRVGDCLKFELNLPPLSEQKRISQALGSIDQKIQLNRETNKTLEAMAQALFKSWFVDFDPVIDNALAAGNDIPEPFQARAAARKAALAGLPKAQRALFPSEFEETEELGWVPKGWGELGLGSFIKFENGKTIKRSDEGLYPLYGANGIIGRTNEIKSNNAIIIGRVGAYCGAIEYCPGPFWPSDNTIVASSNKSEEMIPFILYLLKFLNLNQYAGGAAQPLLNQATLKSIKLSMPCSQITTLFNITVKSFLNKIIELKSSIEGLESIRDTLLPKLISGELRLPAAEKQAEALVK